MRLLLESRWSGAFFQPILRRRPWPVSCGVFYNSRSALFRPAARIDPLFECSFCCLARLLLKLVFWRRLKVIALRFHGQLLRVFLPSRSRRAVLLPNYLSQRLIDPVLPARSGFLKVIKNVPVNS
jgi:hypothetical protein